MTYSSFLRELERVYYWEKRWNFIVAGMLLCMGLLWVGAMWWWNAGWETFRPLQQAVLLLPGVSISALGSYGFWKIPRLYGPHYWSSGWPVAEKSQRVDRLPDELPLKIVRREENHLHLQYGTSCWDRSEVHLFYDDVAFAIFVKPHPFGSRNGYLDFGLARRVRSALRKALD